MCVKNDKVSWSKNEYGTKLNKKKGVFLSCDNVLSLLNWLLDNTYVRVGNKIFKQCIEYLWALIVRRT